MDTYRLSASGRRTALILMVSALIIWAFALWTLRSTLGSTDDPALGFAEALRINLDRGLTIGQIIPALLMVVLIVAAPLVIWNTLEEWDAAYTVADDGLHFRSLGIALTYPWSGITALRRADDDVDEPVDELLLADDYTRAIRNPLLRFLHRQAFGRDRLTVYAGVERRDELLAAIRSRASLAEPALTEPALEA
ncbi:MAG TPA: hypothetical protein VFS21_33105 [Roseiflexaceae bacterium]|nr:hypothetical protein [Roseiflexaceae bacterium]